MNELSTLELPAADAHDPSSLSGTLSMVVATKTEQSNSLGLIAYATGRALLPAVAAMQCLQPHPTEPEPDPPQPLGVTAGWDAVPHTIRQMLGHP
ncbi:MAG: hypothetical protein JWM42_4239 [Burkholderia sp.]|nr:hypothetical protein [Burkholderia sp.]